MNKPAYNKEAEQVKEECKHKQSEIQWLLDYILQAIRTQGNTSLLE